MMAPAKAEAALTTATATQETMRHIATVDTPRASTVRSVGRPAFTVAISLITWRSAALLEMPHPISVQTESPPPGSSALMGLM